MVKDGISDLIVSLKNASAIRKEIVVAPYSKLKADILDVLVKEGFVDSYQTKGKKVIKGLEINLKYDGKQSIIRGAERVSKFSKRIYVGVDGIRSVKNGTGILVLTTPKGILTDRQARKEKVGGEVLFKMW